jgi:transcriptional regulator with GAF, ATPase, and Fis domain
VAQSGEGLAEVFADIARQLQAQHGSEKTQRRVTQAAVDTVEGCDHAAISVIRRSGAVETVAATDDVPPRVDAIQYDAGQGPCLDAMTEHQVYLIDDLVFDARWPVFSRRAVEETGVRSMLSFRLFVDGDTIGVLSFYSRKVAAFDEHARAVGAVLAAHASVALTAVREQERAEQLQDALDTSREIGMAMGVLMGRSGVTEDQAFALLRRASQHLNRKLRQVAAEVVETGRLPERRVGRN